VAFLSRVTDAVSVFRHSFMCALGGLVGGLFCWVAACTWGLRCVGRCVLHPSLCRQPAGPLSGRGSATVLLRCTLCG
jgi:hypothetical protein